MFGFLVLNKPQGITSRKTLDFVERLVRPNKVGHAGTLDPLAEGVLVACIGPATKLVRFVQSMPKAYIASFRFGLESDTEDIEGKLVYLDHANPVAATDLTDILNKFVGRIEQQPPKFSALRVQGKRAYDLARKGESVELKPRAIEVYEIELVEFCYPDFQLRVKCGSGTYIRSLGRDMANELGTAAVMTGLTRTLIGGFALDRAISWEQLQNFHHHAELEPFLIDPVEGLRMDRDWPMVTLSHQQIQDLRCGRNLVLEKMGTGGLKTGPILNWLAIDAEHKLLAIMDMPQADLHRSVVNFMGYWDNKT